MGDTESTSSLHTSTNVLDVRLLLRSPVLLLKPGKELLAQGRKARHHIFANQILSSLNISLLRNLDLELAPTKP